MKAIRFSAAALFVCSLASVAAGRFIMPSYIPAERLIANATAYIVEEPNDPSGYYTLARIHYLAFVNKALLVGAFRDGTPPSILPHWWHDDYLWHARREEATRRALTEFGLGSTAELTDANRSAFYDRRDAIEGHLEAENWQPERPTNEQLVGHAAAAQWNFYQAIALDPNNALYYLGQASLGEQYFEFLREAGRASLPPAVRALILTGVKQMYLLAYELAIDEDLSREYLGIEGLGGLISHEAGSAYVRLWESEEEIPPDLQEKITTIKANLTILESLRPGVITPIVFSMEPHVSLAELLAPEKIVPFDLDGDAVAERRPWIKPTTGLLAWDSDGDGRITSGRELFGSVTWWLFFSNGYRALDVLDDNRDGLLTGGELEGLSVWFDRNSDGQCERTEMVSPQTLGITTIGTRPTGWDGQAPMHQSGIRFRDGHVVPTYDWIAPSPEHSRGPTRR